MASTGPDGEFDDFLFWNYSGAPPGAGQSEGDAEPPRIGTSAFGALSSNSKRGTVTAFLARTGSLDGDNVYADPLDGIYIADQRLSDKPAELFTVAETGMPGTMLDPDAVF